MSAIDRLRERIAQQKKEHASSTTNTEQNVARAASNKSSVSVGAGKDKVTSSNAISRAKSALDSATAKYEEEKAAGTFQLAAGATPPKDIDTDEFFEKMADLRFAMLSRSPDLGILTRQLLVNLRENEELTHLLTDDQLHVVIEGALAGANVEIADAKKSKGLSSLKAKADSLSANDFDF